MAMCGRYASSHSRNDLVEAFAIDDRYADPELPPDFNVAPTMRSAVVLSRTPRDVEDRELAKPQRQLRNLVWGLVPSWAKDPKIGSRMINARAETVAEKPAFRAAFARRRLIVPIAGFYEWFPTQQLGRAGKPLKQPFYLHPQGTDKPLPLAGLYEFWRDQTKPSEDPDAWLSTFTIITTTATDDVGRIHDRMPMTVPEINWTDWLDPGNTAPADVMPLMSAPPPGSLDIYAVSTLVSNVRNNGPELIEPLAEEQVSAQVDR